MKNHKSEIRANLQKWHVASLQKPAIPEILKLSRLQRQTEDSEPLTAMSASLTKMLSFGHVSTDFETGFKTGCILGPNGSIQNERLRFSKCFQKFLVTNFLFQPVDFNNIPIFNPSDLLLNGKKISPTSLSYSCVHLV